MIDIHDDDDNLINKNINGYNFIKLIDQGGMSNIFLVKNINNNHEFVAKVYDNNKKDINISFQIEKECLSTLDHQNIIKLYDFFQYNHFLILILEYCPNKSLQYRLETEGPLSTIEFIRIFKDIISALIHIHSNNISHCDIKPLNILFNKNMKPILCDFGLSTKTKEKNSANGCKGSLAYIAPEILRKELYDTSLADIWSLGVTMFQSLLGKLPFIAETPKGIYKIITNSNPYTHFSEFEDLSILIKNTLKFDSLERWTLKNIFSHLLNMEKKICSKLDNLKIEKRSNSFPQILTFRATKKLSNKKKVTPKILKIPTKYNFKFEVC